MCGPRDVIVKTLAEEYREQPIGAGLSRQGPLVTIFANPETGSWTAVAAFPDGSACIMDTGEGWESAAPVVGRPS